MPVIAQACSNRWTGQGGRRRGGRRRTWHRPVAVRLTVRFEERDPDVVLLFEDDPDPHPEVHQVGLGSDDVGRQPDLCVLVDGHHRHHVGGRHRRGPLLMVDRPPDHGGRPLDVGDGCRRRQAVRADRRDREAQARAVVTALEAQCSVGPCPPEEGVLAGDQGKGPGWCAAGHVTLPSGVASPERYRPGRSSAVPVPRRTPGARRRPPGWPAAWQRPRSPARCAR